MDIKGISEQRRDQKGGRVDPKGAEEDWVRPGEGRGAKVEAK